MLDPSHMAHSVQPCMRGLQLIDLLANLLCYSAATFDAVAFT
jgi:hypothetical protein